MKFKIFQFVPAAIALFGLASAKISYWCMYSNGFCHGTWISHVYQYFTNPFYNFSLYFLPIAIILIFVSRPVFNSWLKFAVWMIPLAILFIAATPVSSSVPLDLFPFYRDDAARLAGGIFSVVSLALILWKSFTQRRNPQVEGSR